MVRKIKMIAQEHKETFSEICDLIIAKLSEKGWIDPSTIYFKKIDRAKMWLVIKPYNNEDAYTFSYTMNKPDSVRWMFTPDWYIDSKISSRKQPFKKYVRPLLDDIALEMEVPRHRLDSTAQKWKGLKFEIDCAPELWKDREVQNDLVEKTILFLQTVKPYIDRWIEENQDKF